MSGCKHLGMFAKVTPSSARPQNYWDQHPETD